MDKLKFFLLKIAIFSSAVLGYVVFSAMDLEFSIRGGSVSLKDDPISFLIILFFLALAPLFILISTSVLYVSSNSNRNGWLNRKLRENSASYEKAKKEAEEYNS